MDPNHEMSLSRGTDILCTTGICCAQCIVFNRKCVGEVLEFIDGNILTHLNLVDYDICTRIYMCIDPNTESCQGVNILCTICCVLVRDVGFYWECVGEVFNLLIEFYILTL